MTPLDDAEVDRRLREADSVEPAAIDALVTGALHRPARHRIGRATYVAVAAGAVVALVTTALLLPHPPTASDPAVVSFTAVSVGSLLVLEDEDGTAWIIGPDSPDGSSEPGTSIVIEEGDDQ